LAGCGLIAGCTATKSSESPINKINNDDLTSLSFRVENAPEWTDLFYRKSGWFGADGIFSISLDGNDANTGREETLIIFSDTYIGEVEDDKPLPGNKMVNNTIAYFRGTKPAKKNINFHYKKNQKGEPEAFFVPQQKAGERKQHFWLGDGFVNKVLQNNLYLFAYHVEITGPNVFDFIEPDVSIIVLSENSRPPFENQRQIVTPLHIKSTSLGEGNFGAGILVNTSWAGAPYPDGYVYVYGCIGPDKNLVAARNEDINQLSAITNAASNELSVTPLKDGRYLLTFQVLGISDKVGIRIGSTPYGPFGAIQEIYVTPELAEGLWPYNAKAHPALSKSGELLISYNTITPDFWNDIQENAHIYRPRFIKMIFE
jgi:hypothetical protein